MLRYRDDEEIDVEFITKKVVMARKQHKCCCGRPIRPYSRYVRSVYKVDGEIRVYREGEYCRCQWY